MKCVNLFFYLSSLLIIFTNQAADFFQLEHLPQGTRIPVLKLVNLIPAVKNTPIRDAQLEDVYVQAVTETPAIPAHLELLGRIKLKTSLPGLQNIGDLDLSIIGKIFSGFAKGGAPISATQKTAEKTQQSAAQTEREQDIEKTITKGLSTAESLPPARQVLVKRYDAAISLLQDLPPDPAKPTLLQDLIQERAGLGRPELIINKLTDATLYLQKQGISLAEEVKKIATTPAPVIKELPEERKAVQQKYEQIIEEIKSLPQNEDTRAVLQDLNAEMSRLSQPTLTLDALSKARRFLQKDISRPTQTYLMPEQFEPESIAAVESRFTNAVDEFQRRIATAQQPTDKQALQQRVDILNIAEQEFKNALARAPRDAQGRVIISQQLQLQFLSPLTSIENYFETHLVPRPAVTAPPLTEAQSKLQQQYDDTIAALKNLPPASRTTTTENLLKQLQTERAMIPKLSITAETTPNLNAAQRIVEQDTGQSLVPPQVTKPLNEAQQDLNEKYQSSIAAIEKLPQDEKTQTLLEILKQEQKKLVPLDLPSKVMPALNEAQQYIRSQMQIPIGPGPAIVRQALIENIVSQLEKLRPTDRTTELIAQLRSEYNRLDQTTLPLISELGALEQAQRYLVAVGTPPPAPEKVPLKKQLATTAGRAKEQLAALPGQVKEKITALPGQIQEEYQALRAKIGKGYESMTLAVNQASKDLFKIGGALFIITLQNPDYRPFQNIQIPDLPPIDVPGIKDIELNNAELGIYAAPPQMFSIWAQGTGRVINIPLLAKVLFNYEKMQDPTTKKMVDNTGIVLQAGLPEEWKVSDSFPEMKSFDRLDIKRAYVYVSTIHYVDFTIPTKTIPGATSVMTAGRPTVGVLPGITIRPGLSLYGEINLRKLVPEVFDHINFVGLETASVYGTISLNPANWVLGIGLPDLIKIENSPFKSAGTWIEINASAPGVTGGILEPYISFVIAMTVQPSPKDETLTFTARVLAGFEESIVAFSMQGFWNNAMGVEGLSIGDLAIQLHTGYKNLMAGIPISGFGFTGTFKFGTLADSPIIKIASLYAMTKGQPDMALQGKIDGTAKLGIYTIIDGCKSLAINAAQKTKKPVKDIDESFNKLLNNPIAKQLLTLDVRNAEFKVAEKTVRIGEFFIQQGFTLKGELTLLGVTSGLDFNLGQSGITATGYLSPIKIGDVFSLTGAGIDKKYGTADDAATISLALNFLKQHFIITGQVKLLGIEQQTDIFIDSEGLNCTITGKLFNMFDASVVLKSRGDITNPDLYFKAAMKQQFTKYIVDETVKALRENTKDAVAKISAAQQDVDKINANIADLDKQITDRKKRIDALNKVAAAAPATSPEITKLGIELTGLGDARIAAVASRDAAQKILDNSRDSINKFNAAQQEVNKLNSNVADLENQINSRKRRINELNPNFLEGLKNSPEITKLGIEVAGLETGKAGAIAARDTATGVLNGLAGTAQLLSTNQGQIDTLNNEIARFDQQIADHKKQIDTLSKQFVQGAQTTPEITKLGLELTGLETAKAGAITSRETAKAALEGVKRWVGGASTIAQAFIQNAAIPLDIRESTLESSIQDIAKGKLPRFTANVIVLGKKLNLDMQLDFSSPEKAQQSANAIAQQILALFK